MNAHVGKALGNEITKSRKNADMTQEEIAEKINISSRTYQEYEAGRTLPRYNTLFRIAKVTNTPPSTFIDPMFKAWEEHNTED